MKLKTYRAATMAEVLAVVKKDLGKNAVILHTRTVKSGGLFGLRRRTAVEVTAADEAPAAMRRSRTSAPAEQGGLAVTPGQSAPDAAIAAVSAAAASQAYARASAPSASAEPAIVRSSPGAPAGGPGPAPAPAMQAPSVGRPAEPVATESVFMSVRERRLGVPGSSVDAEPWCAPSFRSESLSAEPGRIHRELADIKLLVSQVLQSSPPVQAEVGCGRMPEALFRHYLRLLESQVSRELADRLIGRVRDELRTAELADESAVNAAVLRHLAALIPVSASARMGSVEGPGRGAGRPHVIALVGPTGVGKTTTIAKLAATYRLRQGRSVGLITADTYRIAAVDQLRTYASIIGLPLRVAMTPGEMSAAVAAMSNHDVVLIDTAGRSQRNTERLSELAQFLAAAQPSETHLVLSSAASQDVLLAAAESFAVLKPNHVILTKLDEAVNFGVVVNVMQRLKSQLSYVTTGQEVPDHIEPGRADRLARLILDPQADVAGMMTGRYAALDAEVHA